MAGIYVKDNGVWKLPKSVWVKSGTWRVCNNVYVNKSGSWREMMKTVTLTSNKQNFNLWNYVGSPTQPISLIFNITANVTISSYDVLPGVPYPSWKDRPRCNLARRTTAFTVGNFPAGSTVIINNNGYITGGGGFGGKGSDYQVSLCAQNSYANPGGAGGHGLAKGSSSNYDCTIVNTGTIAGGGGGGGGGGSGPYIGPSQGLFSPTVSYGGRGGDGAGITGYSRTDGEAGEGAYKGGNGGRLGEPGQAGKTTSSRYIQYRGAPGGAAGNSIVSSGIEIAVSGNLIGAV